MNDLQFRMERSSSRSKISPVETLSFQNWHQFESSGMRVRTSIGKSVSSSYLESSLSVSAIRSSWQFNSRDWSDEGECKQDSEVRGRGSCSKKTSAAPFL